MNIIFLGCTNSYGRLFTASNFKVEILSRSLLEQGDNCVIHNGVLGVKGIIDKEDFFKEKVGRIISYPSKGNPHVDFIRNAYHLYNDLKSLYRIGDKNVIILLSPFYHIYLQYVMYGKALGYEISVISHEWLPTIKNVNIFRKISGWLYSKLFGFGIDSILPISEFIIHKIERFKKPYIKMPILADYSHHPITYSEKKGFTYCASIQYRRVIDLIIDSYVTYAASISEPQPLRLVLSGTDSEIAVLRDKVGSEYPDMEIEILSKLTYSDLIELYTNSSALLLPLDPKNSQDHARFSQKIAEYLSTGTPMVTTLVGEIQYYFTNKKDAIITEFSVEGFADALKWVHDNPDEVRQIGENGYELGKREFDAYSFGKKLHDFYCSI